MLILHPGVTYPVWLRTTLVSVFKWRLCTCSHGSFTVLQCELWLNSFLMRLWWVILAAVATLNHQTLNHGQKGVAPETYQDIIIQMRNQTTSMIKQLCVCVCVCVCVVWVCVCLWLVCVRVCSVNKSQEDNCNLQPFISTRLSLHGYTNTHFCVSIHTHHFYWDPNKPHSAGTLTSTNTHTHTLLLSHTHSSHTLPINLQTWTYLSPIIPLNCVANAVFSTEIRSSFMCVALPTSSVTEGFTSYC